MLQRLAADVCESTVNHLICREALPENPMAAYSQDLLTTDERERALVKLQARQEAEEAILPAPLIEILNRRLTDAMDGVLEMLQRLLDEREAICAVLTPRRTFTLIQDMELSVGDTHRRGRSVTVLHTDAGTLVYKPRDMRGEALFQELAARYFDDVLGIPRCVAFGNSWGVSEFIQRQRPEGEQAAADFWRRMGGAAAVMKLLGSADMHVENLTCRGGKPWVLDLETLLSPVAPNEDYRQLHPELSRLKNTSPYLSCLLPAEKNGKQSSPLMNTSPEGCAPIVDGRYVPVSAYLEEFLDGYRLICRRIRERHLPLPRELENLPRNLPVRLLVRNTQFYQDLRQKLYHHSALESPESWEKSRAVLTRIMKRHLRPGMESVAETEARQLLRGDIPCFCAQAGSRDIWSDGEIVARNVFEQSPLEHARSNLEAMSDADEAFDLALLRRSILQYPARLEGGRHTFPVRRDTPMSSDEAVREAASLLETLRELCIFTPAGTPCFGYVNDGDFGFRFSEYGLATGLTGIAVFAEACALVTGDRKHQALADRITETALAGLERQWRYLQGRNRSGDLIPDLGESEGLAGVLTGLALLRRYTGREEIAGMQKRALALLSGLELSRCGTPDRMTGMAGLLSALCRFPEYREERALIRRAADNLMAMKTLPHHEKLLWKPFRDLKRPISGAGHGLAGIAQALYAAAALLGEDAPAQAAGDALAFELSAFNEKLGTWNDLRSWPARGYMHGYCSGAPGIGLMACRLRALGYETAELERCAALAAKAVEDLPLNERDHLCCGNAAIAEYLMAAGRAEEAGRLLGGMADRSRREGGYRYMSADYRNVVTASLFYGLGGVGYEMLRFAFPERILSVI